MSLDGLRAWIGEVERKLGARTRVFLVLLAISIGGSGTAIYLAIEAEDNGGGGEGNAAAEIQGLREEVEAQGSASTQVPALEAQIAELRTEVEGLKAGSTETGGTSSKPGKGSEESAESPVPSQESESEK